LDTYVTKKVFEGSDAPRNVWETVSLEQPNDSYRGWTVGYKYHDDDEKLVDAWLLSNGAQDEENVLISICW